MLGTNSTARGNIDESPIMMRVDGEDFGLDAFDSDANSDANIGGSGGVGAGTQAGSGGDQLPHVFRWRKMGPIIGTRTWGGLIGISGAPSLIDGGNVTIPTFRMYDPSGEWFKEGHGVDPDIEVVEDFESLAKGTDAQLEAGIREVMKLINSPSKFKEPMRPKYEKRN